MNDEGAKINNPKKWITLNSCFTVNNEIEIISNETWLEPNHSEYNFCKMGIEDVRLFNYKDVLYYSASAHDENRNIPSSSCGIYDFNIMKNKPIIHPSFYSLSDIVIAEKNWSYFNYNGELRVVYKWYPLSIGKINFESKTLEIIEYKYNICDFFKDIRGSTAGYTTENEIWFIVHKAQVYINNNISYYNYQHSFVVFDLNMNLLRYSELFKFENYKVEFCLGLIIEKNRTIISYSTNDINSKISIYDTYTIKNNIKWYTHSSTTEFPAVLKI
jgi:hypothetical protein